MTRELPPGFAHEPVMVDEVTEALASTPPGVLVDATVGGGGHAEALLRASSRHRLIGIDRDGEAVAAATARLADFGARAVLVKSRFDLIADVLTEYAPGEPVTAVLADLGVSSRQFDAAERGFSYRQDAPLDMRMDETSSGSAAEVVNGWPSEELTRLFAANGEARYALRIASAVVAARPLESTLELAEVIRAALPAAARQRGHPARRVFQAIRIAVNDELEQLPVFLEEAMAASSPGGRIAVLSYHSGEDRIVKQAFASAAAGWCRCPTGLPCVCGAVPAVALLTRGARMASRDEIAANRRARSARLRIAERLDTPWRASTTSSGEGA